MKLLPAVRRVVTGMNDEGKSFIEQDGPTPAHITVAGRPGYNNFNLWRTSEKPSATRAPDDIRHHKGVLPPQGGTVLRVIDFPPHAKDPVERRRLAKLTFAAVFPDAQHQPENDRDAGMHITGTVDYAIVLQGEITAVLEEGETILRAGDVLIQRGTNHAWLNMTDEIARIAFVLVDAPKD